MVDLLEQLFSVIWQEEIVPRQWREGLIVNIFKKGDREDPANYRGITLLSVVGKVFCKILNNRLVQCLDKEGALHEGQAGFRINRSCMDNVYTLNEIGQGRLREDKKTYAFFLDIQSAYDSVWHDGFWYKLWGMGVKGRMWRVIKKMYESSKSAVLLEGEKSDTFTIEQGVAQGCSLSPILFSVFVNDLLKQVEQTGLGIQLSSGKTVGGMLFSDDFVGISDSKESLQKLLDVVYSYCSKWRLRANVSKSAIRPSIEYGSEVWEGNKSQAGSLESIILDGAKRILGCSSKTCNEAVRGDMGLDTLQSRRDRAKLKWWYKLATLPEDRYPKQLFNQKWNIKPRRGRQRKVWSRMVDDLFKSLDIDKSEWLEDIKHGDSSSASFMASVEECISERESRKFEEGLNTKVKLGMYKRFGKSVEFKKYLHGICDAGSRLLFKFRSGTQGLNEELGRHRGREGKTECSLCGNECENVSHVLWECSAYSSTRASFMKKLQELLEDDYEDFESLDNVEKSSYVLGSELWENKFDGLLALVKEYIVDVWEI